MDPNATLAIMLDRARVIRETADGRCDEFDVSEEAVELAEAVENMHEWLAKGGFLPREWSSAQR